MTKLPSKEGLNLVPFIDIMLVLLCIVLSISTFIATGQIKVNLPSAKSSLDSAATSLNLTISVDESGNYYLDNKKVDLASIEEALSPLNKETHVLLKLDEKADFSHFIFLIDTLKEKDHDNFSIATVKD